MCVCFFYRLRIFLRIAHDIYVRLDVRVYFSWQKNIFFGLDSVNFKRLQTTRKKDRFGYFSKNNHHRQKTWCVSCVHCFTRVRQHVYVMLALLTHKFSINRYLLRYSQILNKLLSVFCFYLSSNIIYLPHLIEQNFIDCSTFSRHPFIITPFCDRPPKLLLTIKLNDGIYFCYERERG